MKGKNHKIFVSPDIEAEKLFAAPTEVLFVPLLVLMWILCLDF
jgi:hypothetical protein